MSKGLFDRLQGELEAREQSPGLRMADLLALPEQQSRLLNWMIRQGAVTLADVTAFLGQDEAHARAALDEVRSLGYLREIEMRGTTEYRVRLAAKRGHALPENLWQALDDMVAQAGEGQE